MAIQHKPQCPHDPQHFPIEEEVRDGSKHDYEVKHFPQAGPEVVELADDEAPGDDLQDELKQVDHGEYDLEAVGDPKDILKFQLYTMEFTKRLTCSPQRGSQCSWPTQRVS